MKNYYFKALSALFIVVVAASVLLFLMLHKSEKERFIDLLSSGNIIEAYEFRENYPDTKYSIDSLIDVLSYKNTRNNNDIESLKNYLKKFPRGMYRDSIQDKLYNLEWKELK